jgi:nickel-dependent lactate racemase
LLCCSSMVEALLVYKLIYSTSTSTSTRLDVTAAALKHLIRLVQEQGHKNEEKGKEAHGAHRTTIG